MHEQPDEQLIPRAQQGDRSAFAALVERHWLGVYRWLFGMERHAQTAEDLTQDVFLKAWSALPSYQPGPSFRAWLFRIARNALLDSKRGPRGAVVQRLADSIADVRPTPVADLLARETQALLDDACGRLPEIYRAAFLLWTREELSYAEIAQALAITEPTARWRVCKARKLLLQVLGPHLDVPKP